MKFPGWSGCYDLACLSPTRSRFDSGYLVWIESDMVETGDGR